MIYPVPQLFFVQVNERSYLFVERKPGNFKVLIDSHSNPLFQISLCDSSLLSKHSNLSGTVNNIKLVSLVLHNHGNVVCEATWQQHPLCCIARKSASNQNITCLHQIWVNIDKVDYSFLQLDTAKLFDKPGVCFLHIDCWSFTEGGEVLACAVAANPHKSCSYSALEHCKGVSAVGEKAKAIHFNICDLPRVAEGKLYFLLPFSHVEIVIVREGCADL